MEGLKKLEELEARFGELSEQMADPALVQDQTAYRKIAKSHSDLSELVDKFQAWKSLQSEIESTRPMVEEADAEMAEMARHELTGLEARITGVEAEIKSLLCPKTPTTRKASCSRCAPEPGATRQRFLPPSFSACTRASLSRNAGKSRSSR